MHSEGIDRRSVGQFSEQQFAYALRQAERCPPVGDVRREVGVSEATFSQRNN